MQEENDVCEGARKEENDGITTKATQDLCIATTQSVCVCVLLVGCGMWLALPGRR
jgi:hypothetical protein